MSIFSRYTSTSLSNYIRISQNLVSKKKSPAHKHNEQNLKKNNNNVHHLKWLYDFELPATFLDEQNQPVLFNSEFASLRFDFNVLPKVITNLKNNQTTYIDGHICFLINQYVDRHLLIVLDHNRVSNIFENNQVKLTPTEVSIILAMLSGASLADIAENDMVSYGTRRGQFKSIQQKFQINKNTELLIAANNIIYMHIISCILLALHPVPVTTEYSIGRDLISKSYSNSCRILNYRRKTSDGFLFDFGPVNGRPVICFHSVFQPIYVLPEFMPLLYKHNLRFLLPARPGYFNTSCEDKTSYDEITEFTNELDLLLDDLEIGSVSALGLLRGTLWLAGFIANTKRQVKNVVIASANIQSEKLQNYGDKAHGNKSPLVNLINNHPKSLSQAIRLHSYLFRTPSLLKHATRKIYSKVEADRRHMEKLNNDPFLIPWLVRTLRHSSSGICKDLLSDNLDWQPWLSKAKCPVLFIHGDQDENSPIDRVRDFISNTENNNLKLMEIPNAGILYSLTQSDILIHALLEELDVMD